MTDIESPCNKICTLDPASGLCIGCFRTMEEIAGWADLSDAERARICEALPDRGQRLAMRQGPSSPRWTALRCAKCGAGFACGAEDREHPCWCTAYPPVAPTAGGCLCPNCLRNAATTTSI